MKIDKKAFGIAFVLTLCAYVLAWALTTDQIWQKVYDSGNTAIRVNQVAP